MKISLALVEDKGQTRNRLVKLFNAESDLQVVAACANAEDALQELPLVKPQVALMDILLSGPTSGVDCVRQLHPSLPGTQFMMLTVVEDPAELFNSILAGATGYLLKTTPPERLLEAVRELHAGGSPISSSIARKVLEAFKLWGPQSQIGQDLSPRELEVLQLLARGRAYKDIAGQMGLSIYTIRCHVQHIYRKLQVNSRAEALRKSHPFLQRS